MLDLQCVNLCVIAKLIQLYIWKLSFLFYNIRIYILLLLSFLPPPHLFNFWLHHQASCGVLILQSEIEHMHPWRGGVES